MQSTTRRLVHRPTSRKSVAVIAPGLSADAKPGQTVAQVLAEAGVRSTDRQTVRLNSAVVQDLETIANEGDTVVITRNVNAGAVSAPCPLS